MYRAQDKQHNGQLWVSFETYESTVMGARQKYLAGQKFPFSWAKIFPDEAEVVAAEPIKDPLQQVADHIEQVLDKDLAGVK